MFLLYFKGISNIPVHLTHKYLADFIAEKCLFRKQSDKEYRFLRSSLEMDIIPSFETSANPYQTIRCHSTVTFIVTTVRVSTLKICHSATHKSH